MVKILGAVRDAGSHTFKFCARGLDVRCRVERSLLWEITGSLAAAGNDLRVGNQLLFSKPKIIIKQTIFNRAHIKDPRPTSSIQR